MQCRIVVALAAAVLTACSCPPERADLFDPREYLRLASQHESASDTVYLEIVGLRAVSQQKLSVDVLIQAPNSRVALAVAWSLNRLAATDAARLFDIQVPNGNRLAIRRPPKQKHPTPFHPNRSLYRVLSESSGSVQAMIECRVRSWWRLPAGNYAVSFQQPDTLSSTLAATTYPIVADPQPLRSDLAVVRLTPSKVAQPIAAAAGPLAARPIRQRGYNVFTAAGQRCRPAAELNR
jgi:hypothetical protein